MTLEHSNAAPYGVQQTQGVAAVMLLELKVNPTYGADLAQQTVIFLPVTQQLGGHQLYSKKNAGA